MRGCGLPLPAIALIFAVTFIAIGRCEDIYWEGEDGASNEFLEVKDEHPTGFGHMLHRFRRGIWDFFGTFTTSKPDKDAKPAPTTESTNELVDNTLDKDDEDDTFGSGVIPDREPEPKEKTLRVSFLVMEPYQEQYSNRDSMEFRNFSKSIADAVNVLYESLPGTQRASLVRIQSLLDDFKCKITLDIVSTGYEDTDRITKILRDHIKNRANLGSVAVSDSDFSANIIDPGAVLPECPSDELRCEDGHCVPGSARCDGTSDCTDGSDEHGCTATDDFRHSQNPNRNSKTTTLPPLPTPVIGEGDNTEDETEAPCEDSFQCLNTVQFICEEKLCDGVKDCPHGDDERGCMRETGTKDCVEGEFICDFTRCVLQSKKCDGFDDCDDGSDEIGCNSKHCVSDDDFRCNNGHCIEGYRRCDGVVDCSNSEDEQRCGCRPDQFQCKKDGSCIAERMRCDGQRNCRDNSDEIDCPACSNDQWQCDHGSCIKRNKRCDGRVDCPSDRSDERYCIAQSQYFRCSSGKYIAQALKCNRAYDCPLGDYSDEKNCPCGVGDFKCRNGYCIPAEKHCDNTHDCQDGSDEINCTYANSLCMASEYKCSNGICVPADARCNGTSECSDMSDEHNCPCKADEYHCRGGPCINSGQLCNNHRDCPDGDDEYNCAVACSPSDIKCRDGQCIRKSQLCDGKRHCFDGSDEKDCNHAEIWRWAKVNPSCPEGLYQCRNGSCVESCNGVQECADGEDEDDCEQECAMECDGGRCLENVQICDSKPDCSDGTDELHCDACDRPDDFRCQNGECLSAHQKCNNVVECGDGSDEIDCEGIIPPVSQGCNENQFQCRDGLCIDKAFFCDQHRDCNDNSDEENCPGGPVEQGCNENQFQCRDGLCIDKAFFCDQHRDCNDNSDEENCPGGPVEPRRRNKQQPPPPRVVAPYAVSHDGRRIGPRYGLHHGPTSSCKDSEFTCYDGRCIPHYRRCDNYYDCHDFSDEQNCYHSGCVEFEWQCTSGHCIPQIAICDGRFDCYDRSDEQNCVTSAPFPPEDPINYPTTPAPRPYTTAAPYFTTTGSFSWTSPPWQPQQPQQPPREGCNESQFQCRDGLCIDKAFLCDQHKDCNDNSDEENCPGRPVKHECGWQEWRCDNGGCIKARQRCDGRLDCPGRDDSDEVDCPPGSPVALNLKSYPEDQSVRYGGDVVFQCRDEGPQRAAVRWIREGGRPLKPGSVDRKGRLEINSVSVSDSGVYVCQAPAFLGYPSAELRVTLNVNAQPPQTPRRIVCQDFEATCRNGQCIPKSAVCDGKPDCSDRSDEDECDNTNQCEPNQFRCPNHAIRTCILKTWMCDSEDDCGDGSDEQNCVATEPGQPCLPTEFSCRSKEQCIPKAFHCDGQNDCLDLSDESDCRPVNITRPPTPPDVRLNPGEILILRCEAMGMPVPLITWRLNWGHVPAKCISTSFQGAGVLTCPNMQPEDSGAYSCEAISNQNTVFAVPDAIVYVNRTQQVCPPGYFNSEAHSPNECIRCFCFGESTQCKSADLYTYNMPTPLGEGGTRLVSVSSTFTGTMQLDPRPITDLYYYQPLRNGAAVTKLETFASRNSHPYVSLPESYNGNQLTSYGGRIRYRVRPHSDKNSNANNRVPDIIVMGKHGTLVHMTQPSRRNTDFSIEVPFLPGSWQKVSARGPIAATREDIMMTLDNVDMILLRADHNGAGSNISDFTMESAQHINAGLGAASLVEECQCPPGYEGLSCQKCGGGYSRQNSGPWLGNCVKEETPCAPGTYGDPSSGYACRPCPCPMTNRENQFARTCSLGASGSVICDCMPGYDGANCELCAPGYVGNPLISGDSCRLKPSDNCNPIGTLRVRLPDQCECKNNVRGRYCDQCNEGSFFLSQDFDHGCAQCFCTGVTQQCSSSNLRRRTSTIVFNVPQLVDQVRVYNSAPVGPSGNIRYNAPSETDLTPIFYRGEISLSSYDRSKPSIYYWSLPASFAGDKVTAYGGHLTYTLRHISILGGSSASTNSAPDVQLISENLLTFHYFGNFAPSSDGLINGSVPLLEGGWQRPDGTEVTRQYLLLALADVKTILVKATYTSNAQVASLISASIDTAEAFGDGPQALHVEQCVCPTGYLGTSCEDCAPGFTRSVRGIWLEICEPCYCNNKSRSCHPETGVCLDCTDNTSGDKCELCKPGYELDRYNNCVQGYGPRPPTDCNCDPRGVARPCDSGRCFCKENVEGDSCDLCRPGTFGLDQSNLDGCLSCYCSGVTNDCHEATHYTRIPRPATIFGENYGGYSLMDLNAQRIINDHIVPATNESELMYIFSSAPAEELYWSLPDFPGSRILSYGGSLALTQKFETGGFPAESQPGVDVVLVGDGATLFWSNPRPLHSGVPLTYQVPLKEGGWYVLNSDTPANRHQLMNVLKNLRRVLVRATLSPSIVSTAIADVSMDTAIERFSDIERIPAKGIEVCQCPTGYTGTSCESCSSTFYRDIRGQCRACSCNGHECQLGPYGDVVCQCRPPYTGASCSSVGLVMELHPIIRTSGESELAQLVLSMVCKYKAPEPLTIQFYYEGKEIKPVKWYNESWMEIDGWHGEHVWNATWEPRKIGVVECHTITRNGLTLGMLTGRLPSPAIVGEPSINDTNRPAPPKGTIVVRITSPTIKVLEVGGTVYFTCEARSRLSRGPITLSWSKADGYLPQGRHQVDDKKGLLITNAQASDSGRYICQASDGVSSEQAFATLQVPGNDMTLPTIQIRPQQYNQYYEGDYIELECDARGNPTPSISWSRPSRPLPINVEISDTRLIIERATEADSGEYRCTATNGAGSADRIAVITVRPRPSSPPREKLTITPTSVTMNEAQTTRVVCSGTNNIQPGSIGWSRQDGTAILSNIQSSNGVLFIEGARLDNQGVYICQSSSPDVPAVSVLVTIVPLTTQAPEVPEVYNVTVQVHRMKIPSGGNGIIDCIPTGYPLPTIKWMKHQGDFGPGTSQRENSLIISNAQEIDKGYYKCEGLVENIPVAYDYTEVVIEQREPPRIELWPDGENAVPLDSQFEFHCRVMGGVPEPDVMWHRNGGRPLSPYAQILPRNILRFNKIEVNDEGEYTCTATNLRGSDSASAVLKVRSAPEISVQSQVLVNRGEPINVECRANGYPEPMVSIRQVSESQSYREVAPPSPGIAVLRVSSASERDEGYYTCTATSAAGTMDETFFVEVERGDGGSSEIEGSGGEETDQPPLKRPPDEANALYAVEGRSAVIGCNSSGDNVVKWSRVHGEPLQDSARQFGNELIITRASQSDAGYYECSQLDRYTGEVQQSLLTRLDVMRPPSITLIPPTQTVSPGQTATVNCVVDGDAILEVSWRPLSRPFSRRVEVRDYLLIFNQIEVEDAGTYECFAKNKVANTTSVAEVFVAEELRPSESHAHDQYAHVGASVHLTCSVEQPNLSIRWSKDGRPVPKSVVLKADGSLFIRYAQKSDSGSYICIIQDHYGGQTRNNINLHIEGSDCLGNESPCADGSSCIALEEICNGFTDCYDNSDEQNCILKDKKLIELMFSDEDLHTGPRINEAANLVAINKPQRPFQVRENVSVMCMSNHRDTQVKWERVGSKQFLDTTTYGDGSILMIRDVEESDSGIYRCTGRDKLGRTTYEDFNLEVEPGPESRPPPPSDEHNVYTARLKSAVDLPCPHNLQPPVSIEWRREYLPFSPDVRTNEPTLHLPHVTEADAGLYLCRVSNNRGSNVVARAVLRVSGVVPRFNGESWLSLPALKDSFRKFDIEVSLKPIDSNGLILYNSQKQGREGDYLALQLQEGVPKFTLEIGTGPVVVQGDSPLPLNAWHTIRIGWDGTKVTMDVDNTGPFIKKPLDEWVPLELNQPMYIGGVPDYEQLPPDLYGTSGFAGCVSMLVLGREEKDIMSESNEQFNTEDCDSCSPNLCLNNGVCQEAHNERGYTCLCANGFTGLDCDRTGSDACRPGICGPGKCNDTADGFKCICPVPYSGQRCENKQSIEYPAKVGGAFLAIDVPTSRYFRVSLKLMAYAPVSDGIIIYGAESTKVDYGGFTSLAIKDGHLEFRYDLGDENGTVVLRSSKPLKPHELTDVHLSRVGTAVSMKINMIETVKGKVALQRSVLKLEPPLYIGGYDEALVLNKNTGVSGSFRGCIRDVFVFDVAIPFDDTSTNVQECSSGMDRGDIPEMVVCSQCHNGGYCRSAEASACTCPAGFTGAYCESRVSLMRATPQTPQTPQTPCDAAPCRNGGTCRPHPNNRNNYSCDCLLGFAGTNCQMRLELYQSVRFNGNGYLELPAHLIRYEQSPSEPTLVAFAVQTDGDGVLFYQRESNAPRGQGDYLLLRVEDGKVVMEWDVGSGAEVLRVDDVTVTDGNRHIIIAKLYNNRRATLEVDRRMREGETSGFGNVMNADSNIYIGGIPEALNVNRYPGMSGCFDQVELMNSGRALRLGEQAVAGRNTQRCREP